MRSPMIRLCVTVALGWLLLMPPMADAAQPGLPNKVPADTLLYISWPGIDALSEASKDTAMARLMKEPEMVALCEKLVPTLDAFIRGEVEKEGDEEQQAYSAVTAILKVLWKYPTAIALIGVDGRTLVPMVDAIIVVEAGESSAELVGHVETILRLAELPMDTAQEIKAGKWPMKELALMGPAMALRWGVVDDSFVIAFGGKALKQMVPEFQPASPERIEGDAPAEPANEEKKPDQPADKEPAEAKADDEGAAGKSLAENPSFAKAMEVSGGSAASPVLFVNLKAIVETLKGFQNMMAGLQIPVLGEEGGVDRVLGQLGLSSMESLSAVMVPDGDGFKTTVFFHAPGVGQGSSSMLKGTPLTEADLAVVPEDCTWAGVKNVDLLGFYNGLLDLVKGLAPEIHEQVMEGITGFEEQVGFTIGGDLLGSFGDTWAIYDAPSHGGFWFTGIVLMADLKPDNKLDATLEKGIRIIAGLASDEGEISLRKEKHGEHEITYMNFSGIPMPFAPAWTTYKDRWILALYPQMVRTTLDRLAAGKESILDNEDFRHGWAKMPRDPMSMSYVDTTRGIRQLYPLALPVAQMLIAMGQAEGLNIDVSLMPSVGTLTRHMFGNVAAATTTKDGVVIVSYGAMPFGVPAIGEGTMMIPLMAAIALPSLARAREMSQRTVSMANLRQIGLSMIMYANAHDNKLPPDLQALMEQGGNSLRSFISPLDDDIAFDENSEELKSSYIFTAPNLEIDKANRPSDLIIAYEKPENYDGEGTAALFLDGHVEFLQSFAFEEKLESTMEFLKEQGIGGEGEKSAKADEPTEQPAEQPTEQPTEPVAEQVEKKPPTEAEIKEQVDLVKMLVAKGGPVASAIDLFRKDVGRYPKNLSELLTEPTDEKSAEKWSGPYVKAEEDIKDLWDRPLQYAQPGKVNKSTYDLWSIGPDGEDGTGDDIANFKRP